MAVKKRAKKTVKKAVKKISVKKAVKKISVKKAVKKTVKKTNLWTPLSSEAKELWSEGYSQSQINQWGFK